MASVAFSPQAEADLIDIGRFTLQSWGQSQTITYLDELEDACQRLADFPAAGRGCEHIRPGLRRMEHGRHVIFYRSHDKGILISRILHGRMVPEQHEI